MSKYIKTIIATAWAISCLGCGTITNSHVRHMDNKTLELRHYQLARKNTGRFAWGVAYSDMQDDEREQEAIEKEMMRRGLLDPSTATQRINQTPEVEYGNPRPAYQ